MNCPIQTKTSAELIDYCAGRLAPERAEAVEAHARGCPACRELIGSQRAVWQALEHWVAPPVSNHFDRQLYARIDAEERSSGAIAKWARAAVARWSPFSWRMPVAVAAMCAAVALAIVVEMPANRSGPPPAEPQARMEHVDIEQIERTLDDMTMLKQLAPVAQRSEQASSSM
jgi:anti-sigma factor RsiW